MSIAPSDRIAGVPVTLRVHPRARRLRLRFDERRGGLTLTVPPRTSRRSALAWAGAQQAWVETQLARQSRPVPLEPGSAIPFEGQELILAWRDGGSRTVVHHDGLLACGGPREGFARRIETWLMQQARSRLSAETGEAARRARVGVRAVSIGDAASRWGSCSSAGSIRYSWRLILMPPAALRFVVAHEVAHRVHMDHGPAFKALEARLFDGDVAGARLLLRDFGPLVRRVGRSGG